LSRDDFDGKDALKSLRRQETKTGGEATQKSLKAECQELPFRAVAGNCSTVDLLVSYRALKKGGGKDVSKPVQRAFRKKHDKITTRGGRLNRIQTSGERSPLGGKKSLIRKDAEERRECNTRNGMTETETKKSRIKPEKGNH